MYRLGKLLLYCMINGNSRASGFELKNQIYEATTLIKSLLSLNPKERPKASEIFAHPFFWDSVKRLDFLKLVSDSLMDNPNLKDKINQATCPWHGSWIHRVEPSFQRDMGKYREKEEVGNFEHESIVSLLGLISEMFDH